MPIKILDKVEMKLDNGFAIVKGPKGELRQKMHPAILLEIRPEEKLALVTVKNPAEHRQNALWGLFRRLIDNMVVGVTQGFEKKLEINGIGYKAAASGKKLVLHVGYSHPVEFAIPEGIICKVTENVISISGADKQMVGEVAANIRRIRKPEPYLGKGIKYADEVIRRKAGKTVKTAA
jgi:large subunit ribosomal protein L6